MKYKFFRSYKKTSGGRSKKLIFLDLTPLVLLIALGVFLLSGCSDSARTASTATEPRSLTIAAAADLQNAFTEIANNYEKKTGVKTNITFGSTGLLAKQIEEGAPVDIFASASKNFVDQLSDKGLVSSEKGLTISGKLVLAFSDRSTDKPLNDLTKKEIERIAIANPDHAPYGIAAKEALQNAGMWDQTKNKMVYGENVLQTFQFVSSGNADAALISLSQAIANDFQYQDIDQNLYKKLEQPIVVIKNSSNKEAAKSFIDEANSRRGREILKKYGFEVLDE